MPWKNGPAWRIVDTDATARRRIGRTWKKATIPMRKTTLMCLGSALLGASLTLLVTNRQPGRVVAQETPIRSGPRLEKTSPPPPPSQWLPGDEDLTPEERVHVAVYERVNRSVVNINTKVVRDNAFSLFETPSEGAGSGSVLDIQGAHPHELSRDRRGPRNSGHAVRRQELRGHLVGKDESNDVAVLKIDAPAAIPCCP